MIKYYNGAYGLQILLRLHGSAVFKSLTPAALSSGVYILLFHLTDVDEGEVFSNPYAIGALLVAFSFLLTFKMSFSYGRYWEAMTAVYQMHSKWLDTGMELAAFHLQSDRYKHKPPAFGHYPQIQSITRERERLEQPPTRQELEEQMNAIAAADGTYNHPVRRRSIRTQWTKFQKKSKLQKTQSIEESEEHHCELTETTTKVGVRFALDTTQVIAPADCNKRDAFKRVTSKPVLNNGMDSEHASLFLQEVAHLLSLLSAVAFSTLRNDLEQAETPLATFEPSAPWPCVDPDDYTADVRKDWAKSKHNYFVLTRYLFGRTRTGAAQTLYNAARPFRVIGGVSDAEVQMLQAARGPLAKVALVSMWLQEFISREYLAGSTGDVAAPIISRLFHFISDGMLGYNQARKIAYIPFPFPHAQMTSLFILIICVFIPMLMLTYVSNEVFGVILNLIVVMCFTGLHEVSRELENPFQNVPNGE